MGHVGADEGSIEFRDLRDQFLEVMMFLYPSLDFLQHLQRNISGLGLSLDRSGQVPANVLFAPLAAASRPPTMFGDLDERTGQNRAEPGQLLAPGVSHATNERRMFRHFHADTLYCLSEYVKKNPLAKKKTLLIVGKVSSTAANATSTGQNAAGSPREKCEE